MNETTTWQQDAAKVLNDLAKHNGAELERVVRLRSDLQWCYHRLSHLLYLWENPESVPAGFGPGETMSILAEDLLTIRARHKLSDCYDHKRPNGQAH